ncbi:MAG TPA: YceK/YidQ family lipoprotein [Leptospiraceae bacterium]|nr:YceK/YidQ family lipoprotein [Leptospiraceae bacterium]HMW07973.1 YceK/YidQ family lipoprotein [Leptospiraceae bacterium]HMX35106.1 YceK/YidQ family lipoprotein [Leptospiraceae bacterium]HMY34061.1 YceK/YidQ family lipoprotein [Leptospiraceae bacterium]HMZ65728.1 YceK/YidQ family lipoprotein [Leptospiraceae bacterium]
MRSLKKFFSILLVFIFLQCGTTFSIYETWSYEKRKENRNGSPMFGIPSDFPPVYAGLKIDYYTFQFFKNNYFLGFFVLLDFPLSFTFDTILLPITIPVAISHCQKDKQEKYLHPYACKEGELW